MSEQATRQPNSVPIYDSADRKSKALFELHEIWRYRDLVYQMARRSIVIRYKRSALGIAWTMLNPLGMTIVLSIVFSQVFGAQGGYAAYVLSGLMPWNFFAQTTNASMVNLIWGEQLLKRIYVPRTIFSVSSIGVGLVNLLLSLVPLALVILVSDVPLTVTALLFPIPVLFLGMFSLGMGLVLSSVAVRFTDVAEMYQIVLTAWMYLSPVIYTLDYVPQKFWWIIRLNPMYHLITFFRAFVYDGRIPAPAEFLVTGVISLSTLLIGWLIFCSQADELAYRI